MRPGALRAARVLPAAVAISVGAGMLLSSCGSSERASVGDQRVEVSLLHCGRGWHPGRTGTFHLALVNTDTQNGEVRIVGSAGGAGGGMHAVYGDIEPLAAGSSARLDIALGPGDYAVQCLFEASSAVDGPTLHLRGASPAGAARGVTAVTLDDLARPIRRYQAWVGGRLPALAHQVAALRTALAAGDRTAAKRAWLAGHADYERLGAAYDAFGDLDARINGLPTGLPAGVDDPGWTGFHAIEHGLWGTARPQQLARLGSKLARDVGKLAALMKLPPAENPNEPEIKNAPGAIDALTFSIRAHEISENALQVSLTGKDDFGAHASLAAARANLDGTTEVLDIMQPLLEGRVDRAPIDRALARARFALHAAGTGSVRALPVQQRERVDSAISALTEVLAPVAAVLEPRRAS